MCNVPKKAISKTIFNIRWNLEIFGVLGTPEYQRVTSKGSRTIRSERPDKRDKTGFGSVASKCVCVCVCVWGGGVYFRVVILPQLNSVGSGVVWVTGLFSLYYFVATTYYLSDAPFCISKTSVIISWPPLNISRLPINISKLLLIHPGTQLIISCPLLRNMKPNKKAYLGLT